VRSRPVQEVSEVAHELAQEAGGSTAGAGRTPTAPWSVSEHAYIRDRIGDRSQPVTYRVTTGRRGGTGCDAEHCDASGWSQTGACSGQEDRWCLGARWIRVTEWIRRGVAVAVGHGGIEYRVVAGERSCGGVV